MRKVFTFVFVTMTLVTFSQEDTTKKIGINIFVCNGFYDIHEIKVPYYKSNSFQLSYGAMLCYRITPKIKFEVGTAYTEDSFIFQQYDPSYGYYEMPSMVKHMAYVDIDIFVGYNLLTKERLRLDLIGGFMQGTLVRGKEELNSIYSAQYPYYTNGLPYQFNRKVNSFFGGLELKYQINKTIGLAISPIFKKTGQIAKNEGNPSLGNALISLTFDF
jgi:hypothetical protein